MTNNKVKGNIAVLALVASVVVMALFWPVDKTYEYESKIRELTEDYNSVKDSVAILDSAIAVLQSENDSLTIVRNDLTIERDSAFTILEKLSKPVITSEDKNEALLWIQEHNSSLE